MKYLKHFEGKDAWGKYYLLDIKNIMHVTQVHFAEVRDLYSNIVGDDLKRNRSVMSQAIFNYILNERMVHFSSIAKDTVKGLKANESTPVYGVVKGVRFYSNSGDFSSYGIWFTFRDSDNFKEECLVDLNKEFQVYDGDKPLDLLSKLRIEAKTKRFDL